MNRPRQIWILFALSLVVVFIALGRVTFAALNLDDAQRRAEEESGVEERVRLALWRVDSALALLVAEEDAHPVESYDAFHRAQPAFTASANGWNSGEVLVPSPLLGFSSSNIWLHFQFGPAGHLSSPEAPAAEFQSLADRVEVPAPQRELAQIRLNRLQELLDRRAADHRTNTADPSSTGGLFSSVTRTQPDLQLNLLNREAVLADATEGLTEPVAAETDSEADRSVSAKAGNRSGGQYRVQVEANDLQARYNTFNNLLGNQRGPNRQELQARYGLTATNAPTQVPPVAIGTNRPLQIGRLTASWVADELLLTRRVNLTDGYRVQGCWVNWPVVRANLIGSIHDLFPNADLQVAPNAESVNPARRLVALRGVPLELLPGSVQSVALGMWSPVRVTLVLAWVASLCAAMAVGLLLNGAVSLSERRAAFVSAVTHELRTPLTTFKMYSEMLADEMVTDPTQRRRYLDTLCSEADRLMHLVENVLAFARLERGSARSRIERIELARLIDGIVPRLTQRADLAGSTLHVRVPAEVGATAVHVDVTAVEQILFNLVDNACKHGSGARVGAAPIELDATQSDSQYVALRVRDHGPGVAAEVTPRLFQPFCRSADEAARSAPGVGLGLALCRRLVRGMGGDLVLDPEVRDGACFIVTLPLSARGSGASLT